MIVADEHGARAALFQDRVEEAGFLRGAAHALAVFSEQVLGVRVAGFQCRLRVGEGAERDVHEHERRNDMAGFRPQRVQRVLVPLNLVGVHGVVFADGIRPLRVVVGVDQEKREAQGSVRILHAQILVVAAVDIRLHIREEHFRVSPRVGHVFPQNRVSVQKGALFGIVVAIDERPRDVHHVHEIALLAEGDVVVQRERFHGNGVGDVAGEDDQVGLRLANQRIAGGERLSVRERRGQAAADVQVGQLQNAQLALARNEREHAVLLVIAHVAAGAREHGGIQRINVHIVDPRTGENRRRAQRQRERRRKQRADDREHPVERAEAHAAVHPARQPVHEQCQHRQEQEQHEAPEDKARADVQHGNQKPADEKGLPARFCGREIRAHNVHAGVQTASQNAGDGGARARAGGEQLKKEQRQHALGRQKRRGDCADAHAGGHGGARVQKPRAAAVLSLLPAQPPQPRAVGVRRKPKHQKRLKPQPRRAGQKQPEQREREHAPRNIRVNMHEKSGLAQHALLHRAGRQMAHEQRRGQRDGGSRPRGREPDAVRELLHFAPAQALVVYGAPPDGR